MAKKDSPIVAYDGINKKQRDTLNQNTPEKFLYTRQGRGGLSLTYVKAWYVTKVLNDAFGINWSFDTQEISTLDMIAKTKQIVVKGSLSVVINGNKITKQQYGSAEVKFPKEGNMPIDIGDDYKAAASDALKKCASMFGVAADVYSGGELSEEDRNGKSTKEVIEVSAEIKEPSLEDEALVQARKTVYDKCKEQFETKEAIQNFLVESTGKDSFLKLDNNDISFIMENLAHE